MHPIASCIGLAALIFVRSVLAFELDLPVRMQDVGYRMFGVAPYGYHVAEHRYDGHPGLDFETLPGAKVYAAIGGSVQVFTDSHSPDKQTLQISFSDGGKNYRLVHTNLAAVGPGVGTGATVSRGQALGTAGSQTQIQAGGVAVTYAMTHFQLDDFSANYGLTNTSAVSPEPYFSAAAKADLASIWAQSAYWQMVCEPYLTNPRGLIPYPTVVRVWSRTAGSLANRIDFACDYSSSKQVRYTFHDGAGESVETGYADITEATGGTSTIDFTSASGVRKGVVYVKDSILRVAYSAVGGTRPADFGDAAEYGGGTVATPVTGLWWNESESGWGISLTQHGSTIFAAWYTYDPTGNPSWLVMSSCVVVGNACSGDVYSVTGGTSLSVPWNGGAKSVTRVGSGTLSFADGNAGVFNYNVNGVGMTRNIRRLTLATGTVPPAIDYSDLWWNAGESGWGVALAQEYGTIVATLFTYDAGGNPVWYVATPCIVTGSGCTGDVYRVAGGTGPTVAWNGSNKVVARVGSISFSFADAATGTMSYSIDGAAGSRQIVRQNF